MPAAGGATRASMAASFFDSANGLAISGPFVTALPISVQRQQSASLLDDAVASAVLAGLPRP